MADSFFGFDTTLPVSAYKGFPQSPFQESEN